MLYRDMLKELQTLTEDQLDQEVTVLDATLVEYYPVTSLEPIPYADDGLEKGTLVIRIDP